MKFIGRITFRFEADCERTGEQQMGLCVNGAAAALERSSKIENLVAEMVAVRSRTGKRLRGSFWTDEF